MEWLSEGANSWQLTAATLVGLMSIPGLVVLYGGVMQKRWSVNSMMMAFVAFAVVLILWVLLGFKMGFGEPVHIFGATSGFFGNLIGKPASILNSDCSWSAAGKPWKTRGWRRSDSMAAPPVSFSDSAIPTTCSACIATASRFKRS